VAVEDVEETAQSLMSAIISEKIKQIFLFMSSITSRPVPSEGTPKALLSPTLHCKHSRPLFMGVSA
jgi:hypothetical protein